jgi:hypothetical protein
MALGLDFLQRILNVHWGGAKGTYVVGSAGFSANPANDVWTNQVESETELTGWSKTFSTPSTPGQGFITSFYPGSAVCGWVGDKSHGKKGTPLFVLGGQGDDARGPAMILTSSDGVRWLPQIVYPSAHIYMLTWEPTEQAFYAGMVDYPDDPFGEDETVFDIALRSSTGSTWTESGRKPNPQPGDKGVIEVYCSHKVEDTHGSKVPTSIFGYDKDKDILITPDPVILTFGQTYVSDDEYNAYGQQLRVQGGNAAGTRNLPPGMAKVWAVAFAAGIWQAAGETGDNPPCGVVATSVDDGLTWAVTFTDMPGSRFSCVAAAEQEAD